MHACVGLDSEGLMKLRRCCYGRRPIIHRVHGDPNTKFRKHILKATVDSAPLTDKEAGSSANRNVHERVKTGAAASTSGHGSSIGRSVHVAIPEPSINNAASERIWEWGKFSARIRYVHAGNSGPPLLLVHGFGVGAYHFDRNISELSKNHRVWAVELLGQGSSWPEADNHPTPLSYSISTWTEQLCLFIQEVIGEPAYIAGNSLGGYLAVCMASSHPDLVKGLILLNATPFWSLRPPLEKAQGPWGLLQFDGSGPVPPHVRKIIEVLWWNNMRNESTIRDLIQMVYHYKDAADDALVQRIVDATLHPRALDAFTSILLSPQPAYTFDHMLDMITCPICMVYGREDPWVVPLWGQRLKRRKPRAVYLELSPGGHCPHHEAPTTVNWAIDTWIQNVESGQQLFPLKEGDTWDVMEAPGRSVRLTHRDGGPGKNVFEALDYAVWNLCKLLPNQGQQQIGKAE